ncbi:hypothetical protein V8C37DRAFT_366884 [Trichoderma ceciliae]
MSNRFISGGTISSSGEVSKDESGHEAVVAAAREPLMKKNSEWEAAQHELEEDRKRREQARASSAAEGQQSLYDILQANKAAKQAAFEEQNKLKNQFRALDDDEIDFLDEVRARARAEEARAKREVEEGLKAFRERQKSSGGEVSATAKEDDGGDEEGEWVVGGRKRKRHEREREALGVKKKAVGGGGSGGKGGEKDEAVGVSKSDGDDGKKKAKSEGESEREPPREEKKTGLGLVAYGSDSDDGEEDD